jgi:hypothetical protein
MPILSFLDVTYILAWWCRHRALHVRMVARVNLGQARDRRTAFLDRGCRWHRRFVQRRDHQFQSCSLFIVKPDVTKGVLSPSLPLSYSDRSDGIPAVTVGELRQPSPLFSFNEVPVVSLYNLLSMKLYVLKITFLVFENTCASVVQRIFSFLEFRILPPSEFILFRNLILIS